MDPIQSEKVVWLEEMDRSRRVGKRQEPFAFLLECRDLLIGRITARIGPVLDQVEHDLFDLAEITTDRDARNQYLAARDECVSKRALVTFGFKRSYIAAWDDAMPRKAGLGLGGRAPAALGLSLLDNDELEEDIAISKMSAALERACEEELFKLTGRVGELMGLPQLDNMGNPLRPRLVCEALHTSLSDIGTGTRAKVIVLGLFEQYFRDDLREVYRSLEQRLARRQGDADGSAAGKRKARKTFAPSRTPSGSELFGTLARLVEEARLVGKDDATTAPSGGGGQVPPGHPGGQQAGVAMPGGIAYGAALFNPAGAGMGVPGQPSGQPGHPGSAQGFQGMPLPGGVGGLTGFPEGAVPVAANSAILLTSLTALQRGDLSALGGMGQTTPSAFEAGSNNILHALRQAPLARDFGTNDAVTFDIVAMLFDFIFEDDDIPELMKARIGRLQIPVVKVALIDKSFFSSRQHPARLLVDSLADAAQSWVPDGLNNDRLLSEVDNTVQRILDRFESDVGVFEEALAQFTTFMELERARERELAQASAHVVLARERKEIAMAVAIDEIHRRLEGKVAPQAVTRFMLEHWSEVLARIHVRHGETAQEWLAGLATMDELIWSVAPKLSSPERNQLVARLPQLLRRLQSGMDLVEVDSSERNAFFTALVACHASAVKMGLRTGSRESEDVVADLSQLPNRRSTDQHTRPVGEGIATDGQMAPLLLTEVEEDGVHLEEIRLDGEREGKGAEAPTVSDDFSQMVADLQRGACVEFVALEGRRTRCKLAWVSPLKGIYLFTRQPGRQALSVSPDALAAALRAGEATILSDAPLFDRAVDSLLGALTPA